MNKIRTTLAAVVIAAAVAVYFVAPPAGASVKTMHSAALVVFTVGMWAIGAMPEHVTGLLFFLLAMVLAIAPAHVVFSGFTSGTLWLVLGGLIVAQAVNRTGLAERLASVLFDRHTSSYPRLVTAVVVMAVALAFVMPATIGRVLLLVPIVTALSQRVGLEYGSSGYNGICLAAIMATFQCGTAILPANAPNLVLAGAAETLYGIQLRYAEYLWVQFPVMALLKGIVIVACVCTLFRAEVKPFDAAAAAPPLTAEQKRMAAILVGALVLWATDFAHGIEAGWIALGAGVLCVLPYVGVLSYSTFDQLKLGPYFYIAAALGLGLVTQKNGLSDALGTLLQDVMPLAPGAGFHDFMSLSLLSTIIGVFTTTPAQPAILAPLAQHFAEATGWSLRPVLMTMAVGFSTLILPYQVPPIVVGLQVAGVPLRTALTATLPISLVSLVLLLPLDYVWWRAIGFIAS